MSTYETAKVRAVEDEIQTIIEAFERLIDMGVPGVRMDLIIDHLRNKYGYKRKNRLIA